ncbi:MAG: SagB/ThcOx family dehydrogenase [Spartobacteria bacterium]|nr:SagB/ThcOx family dehydrogenase [Spartobacteria bacterium]
MKNMKLFVLCIVCAGALLSLLMWVPPAFSEPEAEAPSSHEVMQLPTPRQDGGMPVLTALKNRHTSRAFSERPLPPQVLSDLLWAAFGVNRPDSGMRTAPSSYNWQDISIYVFTAEGVWIYNAGEHQLTPVMSGDHRKLAGMQSYVAEAPLSLVYVSDFAKMTRGDSVFSDEYKLMMGCIDAGHISQNVYLFCASEGLGCVARASVDREQFTKTFNLPDSMKVILGQTVGYIAEEE